MAEIDISSIVEDIICLKTSGARIEANLEHVMADIDNIKVLTDKIPFMENDIKNIKDGVDKKEKKNEWSKQYFLMPIITGAVILIFQTLLNIFFK